MDAAMMKYMTPEQIQAMAAMEDPEMAINALAGLQKRADAMHADPIQTNRSVNGIAGRISPWEVAGNVATNAVGAYMNKNLADQYKAILDRNNGQRGEYAKMIAEALRQQGVTPYVQE